MADGSLGTKEGDTSLSSGGGVSNAAPFDLSIVKVEAEHEHLSGEVDRILDTGNEIRSIKTEEADVLSEDVMASADGSTCTSSGQFVFVDMGTIKKEEDADVSAVEVKTESDVLSEEEDAPNEGDGMWGIETGNSDVPSGYPSAANSTLADNSELVKEEDLGMCCEEEVEPQAEYPLYVSFEGSIGEHAVRFVVDLEPIVGRHDGNDSHQRDFLSERPFACTICKARFKTAAYLKRHADVHSGISKPHKRRRYPPRKTAPPGTKRQRDGRRRENKLKKLLENLENVENRESGLINVTKNDGDRCYATAGGDYSGSCHSQPKKQPFANFAQEPCFNQQANLEASVRTQNQNPVPENVSDSQEKRQSTIEKLQSFLKKRQEQSIDEKN